MFVVADATPLNTLIRLGLVDILPRLYGQVVIPPAVQIELSHPGAPKELRDWMEALPSWLIVRAPADPHRVQVSGAGEREAIALAVELKADFLLADDKEARSVSRRLNIPVTGTVGILELAAVSGSIELEPVFEKLRRIDFFIEEEVLQMILARYRSRSIPPQGETPA